MKKTLGLTVPLVDTIIHDFSPEKTRDVPKSIIFI